MAVNIYIDNDIPPLAAEAHRSDMYCYMTQSRLPSLDKVCRRPVWSNPQAVFGSKAEADALDLRWR